MMARREFLGAALSLPAGLAATPAPDSGPVSFRVVRENKAIGTHTFDFARSGDVLTVRITVEIAAGFGPITLYRYGHQVTEVWKGNRFVALDAATDDNGTRSRVSIRRQDMGLIVTRPDGTRYTAPADALPATHWNRAMLTGPMINNQTAELLRPRVKELGREPIRLANGSPVEADHFALRGDVDLDTWYEPSGQWAGLSFLGKDKSMIRYERV